MQIVLVNYADENFKVRRRLSVASAKKFGIKRIVTWDRPQLLKTDFYLKNKLILDQPRGSGYWLWKPYIILDSLQKLNDGDVLVYLDCGLKFALNPSPLVELCKSSTTGILICDNRPVLNCWFTKRDVFTVLNSDSETYWNSFQVMAGFMLVRKSDSSVSFVSEWLKTCEINNLITDDPSQCGLPELPGFVEHRHDQSLLSVLVKKKEMETYRNPTFHGNYLKPEKFRVKGERLNYPFFLREGINTYSKESQGNSPYGTIIQYFPKNYESWQVRLSDFFRKVKHRLNSLSIFSL